MAVSLLDVNVLLALAWPGHINHEAAHTWFDAHYEAGWATCPLTQLSFARLSMQPAVVKVPILFGDVMDSLTRIIASPTHHFWPQETGVAEIHEEIRNRLMGHNQINDALLLDLAIRNGGQLATFDRRIPGLLPAQSTHAANIAIIPA